VRMIFEKIPRNSLSLKQPPRCNHLHLTEPSVCDPTLFLTKFKMAKIIGEGKLDTKVYMGVDVTSGEKVAIKLIQPCLRNAQTMEKEKAIMQKLSNCPGVARFKGCGRCTSPTPVDVLVTSLGSNGDLHFDPKKGDKCYSENLARSIFTQLVKTIKEVHSHGLVHLDLKLENVVFDDNYNTQIIDWEYSQEVNAENLGYFSRDYGTKSYKSPQITRNSLYSGTAADIWALGCCLFVILNGQFPFEVTSSTDWYYAQIEKNKRKSFWHAHGLYTKAEVTLTEQCKNLLDRIFEVDEAKRISIEEILRHPWMQADVYSQAELFSVMTERNCKI